MRIKVPITHYEEVEISDRQARDIAIRVLRTVYDLPSDCFVKGDLLIEVTEEYGGTHSWEDKREYRRANQWDPIALEVIDRLRKWTP